MRALEKKDIIAARHRYYSSGVVPGVASIGFQTKLRDKLRFRGSFCLGSWRQRGIVLATV
jgi:hypothetical protein